jgi:hypothetical protein
MDDWASRPTIPQNSLARQYYYPPVAFILDALRQDWRTGCEIQLDFPPVLDDRRDANGYSYIRASR